MLIPNTSTLIFLVTTLCLYLGVVYTFSTSQAYGSARSAIHLAIALMDVIIFGMLVRQVVDFRHARASPRDGQIRLVLTAAACVSLLVVVLLHADYVMTRYRGAEDGVAGSLLRLKSYLLAAQLLFVFFTTTSHRSATPGVPAREAEPPGPADLLLLLLAAIPLVNYLSHNAEVFSFVTAVEYIAFFLVCPLVVFVIVYAFQRALYAPPLAVPSAAGLAFVFYSMPAVSSLVKQPVEALFSVHLALAVAIPGMIAVWYARNPGTARTVLAVVAAFSIGASAIQAATGRAGQRQAAGTLPDAQRSTDSGFGDLLSLPAVRRPNVYFLVYDGLAAPAMMKKYGIDPAVDTALLEGVGFTVYDGAYSTRLASRPSMTSVLDMRAAPRAAIAADNTTIRFFRKHGYKTHLVLNAYLLLGSGAIAADAVFPPGRRQSGVAALYRGIATGEFKADIVFQDSDREEWLAAKRAVLAARDDTPVMLYAHSGFPGHSQNSGTCLADEQAQYAERLRVARQEMQIDIETILENDSDAVIIVAGDHGPYLTGDCLYMAQYDPSELTADHLADRYGALLAIRWPEGAQRGRANIRIIQDIFFAVSSYVLDDEGVWRHRMTTETVGFSGIPDGAVKDGVVMVGKDQGQPLFER